MKVAVVGGCLLDLVARPVSSVSADASNEADIRWGPGGAARNVAENLARLGARTTLVTDLADDFPGRFLLERLAAAGIETRLARRERTGLYLAFLHADGSLEKGYCRTGTEQVTLDEYLAALPDVRSFDAVVLDTNLSAAALAGLAARCREAGVPFALQTVAAERARRAQGALQGCTLLKPNRIEAAALAGLPCGTPAQAGRCAAALRERGAEAVLLSLGPDGFWFDGRGVREHRPAAPARLVDVTGAGDALFAAALAGLLLGLPVPRVLDAAGRAAALACESAESASPALGPWIFEEARLAAGA